MHQSVFYNLDIIPDPALVTVATPVPVASALEVGQAVRVPGRLAPSLWTEMEEVLADPAPALKSDTLYI